MEKIDPVELSNQLKKPSGELGHEVAQELNETNQYLYELAWEMIDFTPVQEVLEIGFGNGKHLSQYFELNPDITVTGVDLSQEMCEEARAFHPDLIENKKLIIHCADSLSMPVADQAYDLVMGLNIIYFWDPLPAYLEEVNRVLTPGGKLLLGYRPRHAVEHLEFTKQNFILYEPDELEEVISTYGFTVVDHPKNKYSKQAPDGSDIEITDVCLLAEKHS